jgi:Carbohydrate binding domain/Secretion system C-terminal sorting domain
MKFSIKLNLFKITLFVLVLLQSQAANAQNFTGGFNFNLPGFDSTAQKFLPEFPADPIDEADRVFISGNKFLKNGEQMRFWGVNITSVGCFPPKEKAAGIAARMRKMGINLVRFHHADNPSWSGANSSLLLNNTETRTINPITQDRLEYFIAQLKRNGIYINMNLNVSRTFKAGDGIPGADSLPDFGKGVTFFDPRMIFLQKEYAEKILGHVNPYTGLTMAADPAVAIVEMNNENTLYGWWKDDRLRTFANGGTLLFRHNAKLDSLWQTFLTTKYSSQTALETAWNQGLVPPGVGELMQNAGFEAGNVNAPWVLESYGGSAANISNVTDNVHSGNNACKLQVTTVTGTDWHLQFKQNNLTFKKDSTYLLKFWAKSSGNFTINVSAMRDNAPYTWYAGTSFNLTNQWQEFVFTFSPSENNNAQGRISISPLQNIGSFWFDDFSVAPPSITGILTNESLANDSVKRIDYSKRLLYSMPRLRDMAAFYLGIQKKHFDDLKAFLKTNVGVKANITGTNALSGTGDASTHEDLDFLDDHSYWDHPNFTNGDWNPTDWTVYNTPQVKDAYFGAISTAFSGLNFSNKPFTVSEYNHVAPNRYRTEMPHTIAAYGSFHGMDGLMFFEYCGGTDWESDKMDGFFGLIRDHSVMSLFPSCAFAFRNGLIAEDNNPIEINYSTDYVNGVGRYDATGRWGSYTPYSKQLNLTHSIRTGSYRATQTTDFQSLPSVGTSPYTTSNNETTLNTSSGLLKTETSKFTAISGFLQDNPNTKAGGLTLKSCDDFGSVTWIALGENALATSKKSLLTISSKLQNTNMIWNGTTTVNDNWGSSPTKIDALKTTLQLNISADSILVYPLNTIGKESNHKKYLPISTGLFEIIIDQTVDKSMWFGIEAFGAGITNVEDLNNPFQLEVYPNPTTNSFVTVKMNYNLPNASTPLLNLYDELGRLVKKVLHNTQGQGEHEISLNISSLPKGIYFLEMSIGNKKVVKKVITE